MSYMRDSRGVVMPMTIMLMAIVAILATIATAAAIVSTHQTYRDANVKRATAAAAAGIKAAMYETNVLQPEADECVTRAPDGTLGTTAIGAGGWCPQSLSEDIDFDSSYDAYVSESNQVTIDGEQVTQRRIVSTGTIGGVKRRVSAYVTSATGAPLFQSDAAIRSDDTLTMSGNAQTTGGVASNADVKLSGNVSVCGDASYGVNGTFKATGNSGLCSGYQAIQATSAFSLPQVDQGNVATVNDNLRLGGSCSPGACDTWVSPAGSSFDPSTRSLKVAGNTSLTLSGSVYSFCKLSISGNGQLMIAAGAVVRIYVDAPENCGGVSQPGTISLSGNARLANLNTSPTTLQIYVQGSSSQATSVSLSGNTNSGAGTPLVLNAPLSSVALSGNARIVGAIQAKQVTMSGNAQVHWDDDAGTLQSGSVLRIYRRQAWIECTSDPTGSLPDSGC